MKTQSDNLPNTIVTVPDIRLDQPTKKVENFDMALKSQIEAMVKTLRDEGGVGLAANQAGYPNQVITIEYAEKDSEAQIPLKIFINPEIVEYSEEKNCAEEGCLSVPKIELDIERAEKIKIKYQDEVGHRKKLTPKGLLARILQHEIDHLNGIIFTHRAQDQLFAKFPELNNLNILFLGSGEFASIILEGLILFGFNTNIITEKEKPAGRDQANKKTAVAEMADKFKKKYFEVDQISELPIELANTPIDLIICADFGRLIPKKILDLPNLGAINIHPSLLPEFQGPTPIPSAILAGVNETGVTIIRMSEKIDQGPILAQVSVELSNSENSWDLEERLATVGLKLLIKALPLIAKKQIREIPQDQTKASFTRKFSKEDGLISWSKSTKKIVRQINAYYPWPGSYTFLGEKRLIIHQAHLEKNKLALDIVQPEGKRPMLWQDFLRGYNGPKPKWFTKIS